MRLDIGGKVGYQPMYSHEKYTITCALTYQYGSYIEEVLKLAVDAAYVLVVRTMFRTSFA